MKLLILVGPTSSGKTSLGIELAKKFNGELVSADSRQIYKKLDIGTGKDLPKKAEFVFISKKLGGYYEIDGVKVWGYDLVEPDGDFSVSQYIKIARNIIKDVSSRGKLAILVGGTGFYIKGVIDGIDTARVPKNKALRDSLKGVDIEQLYDKLAKLDPSKAAGMNQSDKNNPRRLIRAIEVAQWKLSNKILNKVNKLEADILFIGLQIDKNRLNTRITKRIQNRINQGFDQEVEDLLLSGVGWENQSMQAMGYKQWRDYTQGKITKDKALQKWFNAEKKYAKKQITWFKRDMRINWYNVGKENWKKEVVQLVEEWLKDAKK